MSNLEYLVAAYALVWAFVFGYLIWMVRRQERLGREVASLRKVLDAMEGARRGGR